MWLPHTPPPAAHPWPSVPPPRAAAILLLLAFLLPAATASARVELRFLETRALPGLGLQLRVMSNSREVPLPAVQAHTYNRQVGALSTVVDLYAPRDLWIADQQGAEWIDPFSNRLVVAAIHTPLPGPFLREHVLPDEYEAARAPMRPPADWPLPALEQWASDFARLPGARAQRPPSPPARFADCIAFTFASPATNAIAYAFRLPPAPRGLSPVPTNWFFALFVLGQETDPAAAQQAIRTRFLQYITPMTPPAPARGAPSTSDRAEVPKSPEFIASRKQVAQSVANLKDWWYTESENYIALSNLKATERSTVRELQANVEILRRAFTKWVPPRVAISAVSVIRIPATETEYVQYVGEEVAWSAGLWVPSRKELVLRPLASRGSRQQREQLFNVAYHEAFHQYGFYALDQVETSPWFGEGQAALFETVDIQSRGVQILEDPVKVGLLLPLLQDSSASIANLLTLSYPEFYAASSEVARVNHYVLAWGLIYYLRLGVDEHSPYAGLLNHYVDALVQTRDAAAATTSAFAGVDQEQLQRDFRTFWLSSGRRGSAQRNRMFLGRP